MVAREHRPLRIGRHDGAPLERRTQWSGIAANEREVCRLHRHEVEQHVELVAVLVAEERACLFVGQVDLAEQDGVTTSAGEEGPQVMEIVVRIRQLLDAADDAGGIDEERDGVDAEPGQPELHPEPHDLGDLVADVWIRNVEVGLRLVEAVQVVLAGLAVTGPDTRFLVGEDDVPRFLGARLVAPDVPIAKRRVG